MENDWNSWQRLVLARLDDHRVMLEEYREKHEEYIASLHKLDLDIQALKIRASIWGGIAGAIVPTIISIIELFK